MLGMLCLRVNILVFCYFNYSYYMLVSNWHSVLYAECVFDSEEPFLVWMEFPSVVLWRPKALDCRVIIPPVAWNGLFGEADT